MIAFLLFLATLAVGAAGGLLAKKMRIPAGAMVGAIAFVIGFKLLVPQAHMYPSVKVLAQVVSGAVIGCRITRDDVKSLRLILLPVAILLAGMVTLNLTSGMAMYHLTDLSLHTALFASAPGGMSDMAIIASDFGANEVQVAFLQLFRILLIYIIMPPIFGGLLPRLQRNGKMPAAAARANILDKVGASPASKGAARNKPLDYALFGLTAIFGGLLLNGLGVAAGAMIGSMLFGAAFSVAVKNVRLPSQLRVGAQALAGTYIGARVTAESLRSVPALLPAMGIMLLSVLVFTFLLAFIIHKCSKLDLGTCMMACTPGGLQEITLLSEELGADTPKIAVMQTIRLIFVILIFPVMIPILGRLL